MSVPAGRQTEVRQAAAPVRLKGRPVVSLRSLLVGAALIPLNCYWMAVMEIQWNSVDATCVSLFFHVVFLVFVLVIANRVLQARLPRFAMTPAEILVIYIMLSIASAIAGRDSMENLLPMLGHPFWFADSANRFADFHRFIPRWLAPQDPWVLKAYYLGNVSIYDWRLVKAWLPIVGAWSAFIMAMLVVMLSINVIVRRHWMDLEKLTFPTVYLPMEMARDGSFFRDRMLWMGFALPFAIETMNGLNYLFPSVPRLNLKLQDVSPFFVTSPWNGIGWTPISFYPFAIGMAFFLPLDLSFSCWFFYVVKKLEAVAGTALGYKSPGGWVGASWPHLKEQGTGAWVGLCVFMVWAGRKQLGEIVRTAFAEAGGQGSGAREGRADSGELISYRGACLGVMLGLLAMFAFCVRAGMSLWLPPVYFGFFFLLSIGITRIRAELGPPAHELNWVNPEAVMVAIFGTTALGTQNLTALSYMFWFNRGYRSHPMPHQLEGLKIAQATRMEARRLALAMVLATIVGAVAGAWALLDVYYRNGEATAHIMSYSTGIGREAFGRLQDWQNNPRPTDYVGLTFAGLGAAVTLLLGLARTRFFWWPFHPIGYALANSYALEYFWSAIFVGWLIKFLVLRYGGARLYRGALPFFLGVILGDTVIAALWSLIGSILGISTYRTFIF